MKPQYDHTIRWLQHTSNCNFAQWNLKEQRVKVFSILKETFNIMTVDVEPLRQCHLSRKWLQPRPTQEFGRFMVTPKMENSPTACCASTILRKVWTSRSRWIFFVFSVDILQMQFIWLFNNRWFLGRSFWRIHARAEEPPEELPQEEVLGHAAWEGEGGEDEEETLPKAQRTRGLSSSCQSHIASSNTNLDQISSSESPLSLKLRRGACKFQK